MNKKIDFKFQIYHNGILKTLHDVFVDKTVDLTEMFFKTTKHGRARRRFCKRKQFAIKIFSADPFFDVNGCDTYRKSLDHRWL